jgi:hypothetical protein
LAVYVNGLERTIEPTAGEKIGSPVIESGSGWIFTKKRGQSQGF